MRRRVPILIVSLVAAAMLAAPHAGAAAPRGTSRLGKAVDTRLTNDDPTLPGYVSAYTLATGNPYTDSVLDECSVSRGRQNEPAVEVDPRNQSLLIGSSNDYCGVYQNGVPIGPGWVGPLRAADGGHHVT